jgi:hypothetical protein
MGLAIMKVTILFAAAAVVFAATMSLAVPIATSAAENIPAFPGAEGFGTQAVGGRGGRVIKVTNLNARGPGSLQAACSAEGRRIVVFDVSGVIEGDVIIEHGNISIMGQTAPGAGITIAGLFATRYNAPRPIEEVVVRYLRVRPPDARGAGGDAIQFSQVQRAILVLVGDRRDNRHL